MLKTILSAAALVGFLLVSAPASACDQSCSCGHGAKAEGAAKATAPAVKPAPDSPVAEKCSCSSASDCTCKKGQCKCAKCGGGVAPSAPEAAPAATPTKA
jgi:hypothetical protein